MTRAELIAELVEIRRWQRTYETNEGSDRARQLQTELERTPR